MSTALDINSFERNRKKVHLEQWYYYDKANFQRKHKKKAASMKNFNWCPVYNFLRIVNK